MHWTELAFKDGQPQTFGRFLALAEEVGFIHALDENTYQQFVANVERFKTEKLTYGEAYVLSQQEPSRGLGDTVAKFTHATKLDKLAELYTKLTGKPCGCSERQDLLNKLVPYKDTKEYKDAMEEL